MFKVCACIVIHFHDAKFLLSQVPRASVYNVNTLPESTGLSSGDCLRDIIFFFAPHHLYF